MNPIERFARWYAAWRKTEEGRIGTKILVWAPVAVLAIFALTYWTTATPSGQAFSIWING